jgi:hypothetical protein
MTELDPYGTGSVLTPVSGPDVIDPYGSTGAPVPETSIRNRRGTAAEWAAANYVLEEGELGYEIDTNKFKVGNNVSPWNELGYFIPEDDIVVLIEAAVEEAASSGGDQASLEAHINSLTPHPVYDDGPSFLLLYQNAKV